MSDRPTFALIGAAGYVAPKHGAAIKAVGGDLVAACDIHDAVGWLDRDWPECVFLAPGGPPGELFKRPWFHVLCTPNDVHAEQTVIGLEKGSSVICEKPLALNARDLDAIQNCESEMPGRVYTILNRRHHPEMIRAKEHAETDRPRMVSIRYSAPRGPWYDVSWKGDEARSGGVIFNVGIHLLDAILWMFGPATTARIVDRGKRWAHIETTHRHAMYPTTHVSIALTTEVGSAPTRVIRMDDRVYDLGAKFSLAEDGGLHAECYREILAGRGPGIAEARPSIELAERLVSG